MKEPLIHKEFYVITDNTSYRFKSYTTAKKVFDSITMNKGLYKLVHNNRKYWQFYNDCFNIVLLEGKDILLETSS